MMSLFGKARRPHPGEQPVSLSHLSAVSWDYFLTVLPSPVPRQDRRILRVAFAGDCGVGAAGANDVRVMESACLTGLWTWQADALILDFTDLTYVWGDDMIALLEIAQAPEVRHRDPRVAVVTSARNDAALRSLVKALGADARSLLFDSRRAAFKHIAAGL